MKSAVEGATWRRMPRAAAILVIMGIILTVDGLGWKIVQRVGRTTRSTLGDRETACVSG